MGGAVEQRSDDSVRVGRQCRLPAWKKDLQWIRLHRAGAAPCWHLFALQLSGVLTERQTPSGVPGPSLTFGPDPRRVLGADSLGRMRRKQTARARPTSPAVGVRPRRQQRAEPRRMPAAVLTQACHQGNNRVMLSATMRGNRWRMAGTASFLSVLPTSVGCHSCSQMCSKPLTALRCHLI